MSNFAFKGRNSRGELVEGIVEAASSELVASQLMAGGVIPVSIEATTETAGAVRDASWLDALLAKPVTQEDTLVLTRQLYTLQKAGVPILRALAGLEASTPKRALVDLLADLRPSLDQGRELAAAMARHPAVFDPFYVAMIRVGEMTGRLTEVFLRLAEHLEFELDVRARVKAALANYCAGAVLMPYQPFLAAARAERYDIELLGHRFRTSFEQTCHRLTTLRRPGAEGVPFHMVRVDIAGNISKRFSASGLRFARFSGACPRWSVFEAFTTPGLIRTQLSEMPDGAAYFWVARTVHREYGGYHAPRSTVALAMGCEASRSRRRRRRPRRRPRPRLRAPRRRRPGRSRRRARGCGTCWRSAGRRRSGSTGGWRWWGSCRRSPWRRRAAASSWRRPAAGAGSRGSPLPPPFVHPARRAAASASPAAAASVRLRARGGGCSSWPPPPVDRSNDDDEVAPS